MVSFKLSSGVTVVPTSLHGLRFSDGTVFEPSESQVSQIQHDWSCLTAELTFKEITNSPVRITYCTHHLNDEALNKLKEVTKDLNTIVIVAIPTLLALNEMNIRDQFPRVLTVHATPETRRVKDSKDKIYDVNNFAW